MSVIKNRAARAIADVTQGMLLATIDIAATPERVFRAVTSEELTRFEAIDDGTRVIVRHEGFGDAQDACTNHAEGWERVLGWLTGHFQAVQ